MKKGIIAIIIMFLIITLLITILPNINPNYIKNGKLYISKILAMNETTLKDNNGEYSDYIELYNGYSFSINLEGYHLSDSEYDTDKWTFPNITIEPKEKLIIYATGNNNCDIAKKICHTNFKLSSKGEVITLSDSHGNIINKFSYPMQYKDIAYGYKNKKYTYLNANEIKKINNKKYKLEITEYMTHNKRSFYDSYGNYFDWVEIHNSSNEDYLLEGIYITDNQSNLEKYLIPKVTIKAYEYIIIYFAGKDTNYKEGIYANFALSDDDKSIIISNGAGIIDKVDIVSLPDNISYGKTKEGWQYFITATPGSENNTAGFTKFGGNDGSS